MFCRKLHTLTTILFLLCSSAYAFDNPSKPQVFRRNSVQLEGKGRTFLYSLNYEYLIQNKAKVKHGFTVGLSIDPLYIPKGRFVHALRFHYIPLSYLAFIGTQKHHLEMSMFINPLYINYINPETKYEEDYSDFRIGEYGLAAAYRFQKPKGRISVRVLYGIHFYPARIEPTNELKLFKAFNTRLGLSVGYHFGKLK